MESLLDFIFWQLNKEYCFIMCFGKREVVVYNLGDSHNTFLVSSHNRCGLRNGWLETSRNLLFKDFSCTGMSKTYSDFCFLWTVIFTTDNDICHHFGVWNMLTIMYLFCCNKSLKKISVAFFNRGDSPRNRNYMLIMPHQKRNGLGHEPKLSWIQDFGYCCSLKVPHVLLDVLLWAPDSILIESTDLMTGFRPVA